MKSKVNFLYKIQPVRPAMLTEGPTAAEEAAVTAHFHYLQELTQKGTVFLAGRTSNTDFSSFGIVILATQSEDEAQEIVKNDPAVKERVMRAELYPYSIALMADLNEENS